MKVIREDFKRSCRIISVWVIFVIGVGGLIVYNGIESYEIRLEEKKEFIKMEQSRFEALSNWRMYGAYGFTVFHAPSVLFPLFFKHGPQLRGFLDNATRMMVYAPETIDSISNEPFLDFNLYCMIVGTFLMLLWGYRTSKDRDYIKYLSNFTKRIILSLLWSKAIIVMIIFFFLMLLVNVLYWTNGYSLGYMDNLLIGGYMLAALILFLFFFFLGYLESSARCFFKSNEKKAIVKECKGHKMLLCKCKSFATNNGGLVVPLVIWSILLVSAPKLKITESMAKRKDKIAIKKAKVVLDFEKKAIEIEKKYEISEKRKIQEELAKVFLVEYKKISGYEKDYISEIKEAINLHDRKSIFNPIHFVSNVGKEISGTGLTAYLEFYQKTFELQEPFLEEYTEKAFKPGQKITPFLAFGKNVINTKRNIPRNYFKGILFLLVLLLIAVGLSELATRKLLTPVGVMELKERIRNEEIINKPLQFYPNAGEISYFFTKCEDVKEGVYAYLVETFNAFYLPTEKYFNGFDGWKKSLIFALKNNETIVTNTSLVKAQIGDIKKVVAASGKNLLFVTDDYFNFIGVSEAYQFYLHDDHTIQDIRYF